MPPLNLYARVRFSFVQLAHETAGAACTRSSLRPLSLTRAEVLGKPRAHHAARMRMHVPLPSCPANAWHPVRRGLSAQAVAALEYWIARSSRATTSESVLNIECEVSISSLRAERSNPCRGVGRDGLLRGACHRARVRATRWLAMTADGIAPYFTTPISRKYFSTPGWMRSTFGAAATVLAAVVSQACDSFLQNSPSIPCSVFANR